MRVMSESSCGNSADSLLSIVISRMLIKLCWHATANEAVSQGR